MGPVPKGPGPKGPGPMGPEWWLSGSAGHLSFGEQKCTPLMSFGPIILSRTGGEPNTAYGGYLLSRTGYPLSRTFRYLMARTGCTINRYCCTHSTAYFRQGLTIPTPIFFPTMGAANCSWMISSTKKYRSVVCSPTLSHSPLMISLMVQGRLNFEALDVAADGVTLATLKNHMFF